MKVFLIPFDWDAPMVEHDAPGDDEGFAEWCRAQVGGYLELIPLRAFQRSGLMMWVNEDAKREQRLPNLRATRVAMLAPRDFIAGEAVITGSQGPEVRSVPVDFDTWIQIVDGFKSIPMSGRVEDV